MSRPARIFAAVAFGVGLTLSAVLPLRAEVTVEPFGKTADGQPVEQYTLKNAEGTTAQIITRGATLRSMQVVDQAGNRADVLLGFDTVAGYESDANQYFGPIVGRVCNRIDDARFELAGERYQLTANDGDNTLHGGGENSLDKVVWEAEVIEGAEYPSVRFRYFSPDGQEGFPGNLHVRVRYTLTEKNALVIAYEATTDILTPVNLTNHAYFNLAGAGAKTILDHQLMIDADYYTPTDDELIPTGEIAAVEGTPLDFRTPTTIGKRLAAVADTAALGYDHNYVLNNQGSGIRRVARVLHPGSGRTLEVLTDQPGLQFYSGNFLKGQIGKDEQPYPHRSAFCLEAQHYPDSVHHPNFPSILLEPGETYRQTTIYRFGVGE
jgi:aldose 1-epimerase